ncbi:hypothetical protein DL96DRAFT_1062840 [Flagelloscypha sp. PMI_526]|nr:hypothetical protein DL96DRAFT_1062840 [Flagelloscypha sp. PMI_526]
MLPSRFIYLFHSHVLDAFRIGFAAFTWNHWTHDVDVVDEYLSTPKNPVIRKERQQVPWYFRVGLIAGQTTFGALIAARLLQVRFRYVRSLAFVPPRKQDLPRTKVGVHAASASNQVKLTSSGKTPALIFMQTASDPTALGQAWPIKNCVLEEIPNSDQLRIFIDGEVGSWFLDPSKGAFYDGKKDHRGALIKAGIVEAWVALKENRFSEPATLEKLEKKIQTATPLSQLKAQTK